MDAAATEVYVADGGANRRVVVFDADDRRLQAALDAGPATEFARLSCVDAREGRHGLRLRSQEQPHPGLQEGRHVREGGVVVEDDAGTARCGTSRSRAIRSSVSSTSPTARNKKICVLDRDDARSGRRASATAAAGPATF